MSHVAARAEVLRRVFAGELPTVADFVVIQANTGDGICKGCGLSLSAGEPRCVIDSVTASLGPFPMHAECFLVWGEACMRAAKHEDRIRRVDGTADLTPDDDLSPAWLKTAMFCQTRLEMLGNRTRGASQYADAVRHMRKSQSAKARAACERARHQSRLAHEAYDEHVRDHGC